MVSRTLRFATFLAPNMFPLYAFIARYVQARFGMATEDADYSDLRNMRSPCVAAGLATLTHLDQPRRGMAYPSD